jgi:superoxide reductase
MPKDPGVSNTVFFLKKYTTDPISFSSALFYIMKYSLNSQVDAREEKKMKESSRRDFVKVGMATAASIGLIGALKTSKSWGQYGSEEKGDNPIHKIKDPGKLTPMEMKHSPKITVEGPVKAGEATKVTVAVGRTMHPMEEKHHIKWIELYEGDKKVARVDLEPEVSMPLVTFMVVLSGPTTLRALEECNLHGVWEESLKV